MSELIVPKKVPLALHPSPLTLEVRTHVALEGETIQQILKDIPDLPPEIWTHGVVFLGEYEVPRNCWHLVKPKGNSSYMMRVCIRYAGGGGGEEGGGKSIIGTIAAIALVIAVTAISGGILGPAGAASISSTLFAAGSTSAALAAAGVAIVGSLAVNALSPTPSLQSEAQAESDNISSLGSASAQGNVIGAGQPIPFVAGRHRVSPPHIIIPWSESINDDQYVNAIVGLNGPHLFEDIWINGTPIDEFVDVEYEVRDVVNDDTSVTLIDKQVFENQVNAEVAGHKVKDDATDELQNDVDPTLSYPQWQSARSKRMPDQIWMTFVWASLIFQEDDGSGTGVGGMAVRMRIRRVGDTDWVNLPELHAQRERGQPFRATVKLLFEAAPLSITRPDQAPSFPPWKSALYVTDTENDENFVVDDYFDDASTLFAANVGQTDGTIEIWLDPDTFPKGTYDVQVKRGYAYEAAIFSPSTYLLDSNIPYFFSHVPASSPPVVRQEQSKVPTNLSWASLASVWEEPPLGEAGMSLIALRAKNVSVSSLSVLATGYANRWNGSDWNTFEPTQNPSAWWRYLGLGGQSIEVPIVEQQLDDQDFQEWHEYCGDRTYTLVFDGDDDYLTRGAGLTGAADSGLLTLSIWARYEDEFDTVHDWTFDDDADNGFTDANITEVVGDDYITLTATSGDPQFTSPSGLSIDGSVYRYVVIDIERVTDAGGWDGSLFFANGGHGFSGSFFADIPEVEAGNRETLVIDMEQLNTGGTDWVTNVNTQLRFDFGNTSGDVVRVYSIKVMSPQQLAYFSSTLGDQGDRFMTYVDPAGYLVIKGYSSAGTNILHVTSANPLIANGHSHILFSCDLSDTNDRDLYINDSEALTVVTYTNASIDFTTADVSIGADPAGLQPFKGSLAEVWFEDGVYTDFSVEANRRDFIDQWGRPTDLGSDGSTPNGSSPILYLSGMSGEFEENKGTGGDFTVNGNPTDALEKVTGGEPILECNAYFSSERSLTDVLQTVAATGHASKRTSDKVGIIIDNDRSDEGPVESFTQRNSSGLTIRRAFPRIPDGLRIRYNNEDNDFQPDEIFVFRKFPANVLEAIDYVGITSEAAAQRRAALDFRQLILRNALYQFDTDIQHLYCTKGSLVVLPYDTVRRHFDSARIVKADTSGGDITDLHLDSPLRLDLIGDARGAIFNPDVETKLLLHFDGADASTTFTDSSLGGHTFTAAGNAQLNTADFRFGSASGRFDGIGDWITASDHADFTLDDSDFTIESWFNVDAAVGTNLHMAGQGDAAGDSNGRAWLLQRNTDGTIKATVWQGTTEYTISSRDIYDDDENNPGWHHVAFVRKSDILWLFIDGVKQGSLAFTGSVNDSSEPLGIGALGGDTSVAPWDGWIDEFSMKVGVASYDDDFVPQTSAFDDPTDTMLTRGAALTGAADSGSCTFSFWLKFEDFPTAGQHIFNVETAADVTKFAIVLLPTGKIRLFGRNTADTVILDLETDTILSPNQWYHICGSLDLSNVANRSVFIDDLQSDLTVATYTDDDIDFTSDDAAVGGRPGGAQLLQGSLAEFWFEDGLFTDFTVEANRRDFLSTNFRPANLDTDGSAPGVQPLVYLSGQDGDFPTNKGTGGGFTENASLSLEYIFYTDSGFPAGVVIQLQDGTTLTAQIDEEGETSVVTFTTPQTLPSYFSDQGAWADATGYLEYDVVTHGGETYAALTDHTSGSSSEPGVGTDWFDSWEPLLKDCLVASGPFSTLDKRMLVLGVKIKPDVSASLTLVDEGPKPYVTGQLGADDIYAPDGSRIRAPY